MSGEFNRGKMKALVHYICHKCADDTSKLGAIKLNKILYYSDVFAYLNWSESITGESYLKRQFGPVPSHILDVLRELQEEGTIVVKDCSFHGFKKKEYISLRDADTEALTSREVDLVDEVMNAITNHHTASSISERSHDDAWEMAQIGEVIPYYTVFTSSLGELDEHDMEWARGVLSEQAA